MVNFCSAEFDGLKCSCKRLNALNLYVSGRVQELNSSKLLVYWCAVVIC